jgi:hypothetical protein
MMASKITQIRLLIMEKLERMLAHWIEHQHQFAIPLSIRLKQELCLRTWMLLSQIQKPSHLLPGLGGLNVLSHVRTCIRSMYLYQDLIRDHDAAV